jgi:hypothetical protein
MLAHQFTEQLPREVLSAILKNAQTWVLFGLQADDARLFAGYLNGLRPEDFQNLPPYFSYQRTIVDNRQTGVYSARPLPPPTPGANPGERPRLVGPGSPGGSDGFGRPGGDRAWRQKRDARRDAVRDVLREAHVPDKIAELVQGTADESEEARRTRVLKLASALYWPAEEGDEPAILALSTLTAEDLALYRRARSRVLDKQERERILAQPWLIPDKAARIERLSALRWGTPCAETEALIRGMLHRAPVKPEQREKGAAPYGQLTRSAPAPATRTAGGSGRAIPTEDTGVYDGR